MSRSHVFPEDRQAAVSLPFWQAARARALAGTGKARIHIVGASVGRGFYASDIEATGWAARVRAGLQTAYGDGGSGFRGVFDTKLFLDAADGNTQKSSYYSGISNNLWTIGGGGWSNINFVSGPTGKDAIITNTATNTAQIVVRGTTVNIYTLDAGAGVGSWTYKIDAASAVTVTTPAVFGARKTTISGLSAGNHTVLFTVTSGYLMLCGVSGENATGVVLNNISKSATDGPQWNGTDGPPVSADWAGGDSYPADLVIWNLSENDVSVGGASVDTAVQNCRLYFDRVRDSATAAGQVDIAIVLDHAGTYDTGGHHWHDLSAKMRALASTYNGVVFDFWSAGRNSWNYWNGLSYWGNASNPATTGTDTVHPSDAGHAFMAGKILDVLTA